MCLVGIVNRLSFCQKVLRILMLLFNITLSNNDLTLRFYMETLFRRLYIALNWGVFSFVVYCGECHPSHYARYNDLVLMLMFFLNASSLKNRNNKASRWSRQLMIQGADETLCRKNWHCLRPMESVILCRWRYIITYARQKK